MSEMITVDGVRYRPEDAERLGLVPDSGPDTKARKPRNKARKPRDKSAEDAPAVEAEEVEES